MINYGMCEIKLIVKFAIRLHYERILFYFLEKMFFVKTTEHRIGVDMSRQKAEKKSIRFYVEKKGYKDTNKFYIHSE